MKNTHGPHPKESHRFCELGFGIPEILVAVALFATAVVSLLGVLASSAHAAKQAQENISAQQVAVQVLEFQRSQNYSSIVAGTTTGVANATFLNNGNPTVLTYAYSVDITSQSPGGISMYDMSVNVKWTTDNVTHSVSLNTGVSAP